MALSLGWHIVVACFGVALPAIVLFAEWRPTACRGLPLILASAAAGIGAIVLLIRGWLGVARVPPSLAFLFALFQRSDVAPNELAKH